MDQIKEIVQHFTAGIIDFEGQKLAERYISFICYVGTALSVVFAYFSGNIEHLYTGFLATFISMVVFSLPIPAYRRHPVEFIKVTTKA